MRNNLFFTGFFLFLGILFLVMDLKSFMLTHAVFPGLMSVVWAVLTYFNAKSFLAIWNRPTQ